MKPVAQIPPRRVAVLIESSRQYGRMLDLGIAQFADEAGNWLISFHERIDWSKLPAWIKKWSGDGILIHSHRIEDIHRLTRAGIPLVSLSEDSPAGLYSKFHQDNQAISRMVVHFFFNRGHRNIAFCGIKGLNFSLEREQCFAAEMAAYRLKTRLFNFRPQDIIGAFFDNRASIVHFLKWIQRQPKPLAIFACNDDVASLILFICQAHGISVPAEVAILGVDDDPLRVALFHPHLSSIETDAVTIGYEAARHLDELMATGDRTPIARIFPPLRIHERESTELFLVDDPLVKAALDLILEESLANLDAEHLAQRLGVSRKTLDAHFRSALHCNTHKHLLKVKMNHAMMRVEHSALSIQEIAHEAGLSLTHFTRIFKQAHGLSPIAYRKKGDHR